MKLSSAVEADVLQWAMFKHAPNAEGNLTPLWLSFCHSQVVVKVPSTMAWAPGDKAVLAPSEANPATGYYRFYVVGWTSGHSAGGDEDEEDDEEGVVVEVLGEGGEEAAAEVVGAEGTA